MSKGNHRAINVLMTCSTDAEVGGVQTVVRDLVRSLEENRRQVHLIYPSALPGLTVIERENGWGRPAFHLAMPAVVRDNAFLSVPVFAAYLPIVVVHLCRFMRRKQIDVVNCHFLAPYFIFLVIAARLARIPVFVSVHGSDVAAYADAGWMQKRLSRMIMRGADGVIACSEALAIQTAKTFPEVRQKVTWVHNGLPQAECDDVREPIELPQPFVLCVSRHVHVKGIDTLLRAFALLCDDAPDLSLVLAGDGPLSGDHKSLAAKLGIEGRVVFAGTVERRNVPTLMSRCAVFVLPSRSEAFGLVLLEAAKYRKPIVCTRVGGSPEIITDGVNGLLVEPDEPKAMAEGILALLHNDGLARQLGDAAYHTLMTRFLWRDRIHDYIDIFEGRAARCLDQRTGTPCAAHPERVTS